MEQRFQQASALRANMATFGAVHLERCAAVAELRRLPFRRRSAARQAVHEELLEKEQLFVGIDYGRSDIKVGRRGVESGWKSAGFEGE